MFSAPDPGIASSPSRLAEGITTGTGSKAGRPKARCPCCNAPVLELIEPYRLAEYFPAGGIARTMLRILAASFGRFVPTELIVDVIYAGVRDGANDTRNIVRGLAYQLRKHLRPYGITITGRPHYGGSYRMHWIDGP